ncbi:MAG: DegT/DnrJ/EryC1/StrS family aminotransferase [Kofleriaceae bacterium]|nr:DegT/DnrJ/EryC1/StrS family aminotransferase [Myxococcales bacterium]MCB9559534.1 DegT/DnrJ/EryC1/StrS family aminotransferase [Kofleriaceae bacterium]MCB9574993.1 DegT/DnrJ/EryC1/StrS family aminotransferase [Kofleriaceae bacterium]
MAVPFFDMRAELAADRAAIDAAIARVLDSGRFIGGPEVEGFEHELAAAVGVRRAVGVSSGTDALLVLGMALDVAPGDEVVTTPLSFFATAGAFARLGARIVFAEVDDATLDLDPAAAAAACGPRTRLVVPVHLFGLPAAPPPVDVPVVEDAAQAVGAAPLTGRAAALSCFPTKNLGALGDAGAVLTDDDDLADRVALLRTQGARPRYHHVALGGNFRLDALQAAILRARLPGLAAATAARRRHAARYRAGFASVRIPDELRLPPDDPRHVYHQFVIRTPRRDALRAALAAAGIGTEIYYPSPLHLQPALAALGYRPGAFPVAERACAEVLALPIHPALADTAPDQVVAAIAAFFA